MVMPHYNQGGTEVFIYMPHKDERFTITTSVLCNYHVTIQEAVISTCDNQFDLDTYIILDEQNQAFFDTQRFAAIQEALCTHLADPTHIPPIKQKRRSRALAHFNVDTQISFIDDYLNKQTQLFLVTSDRPGLLATISRVFLTLFIHLHNAKIATVGERVEDMFYITNQQGIQLSSEEKERVRDKLIVELSHTP